MPPKSKSSKSTDVSKSKSSKSTSVSKSTGKSKQLEAKVDLADDVDYADEKPELEEIEEDEEDEINVPSNEPNKERYEYTPTCVKNIIYVLPENRRTSEVLTKFECTDIISTRAVQIEQGGTCFTDCSLLSDPLHMARKELMDKKCPLDVIRAITDTIFERWHVNEMGLPADF